ncbi:MAG: hypothetical protein JO142_00110 [Burkholderiales bacterium]|nr:hypothetical protein [Burkholderiales bacterium]
MSAPAQASLADLARWLRVEEGEHVDRLELASAWQRLPAESHSRTWASLGAGLVGLLMLLLLAQALATHSLPALIAALLAPAAVAGLLWYLRAWSWRTVVDIDAQQVSLARRGWGVPRPVVLPLTTVQALAYRMEQGNLTGLLLEHDDGALSLPYSGRRELDKLYCNILRHLLQKRRPEIRFAPDEANPTSPAKAT